MRDATVWACVLSLLTLHSADGKYVPCGFQYSSCKCQPETLSSYRLSCPKEELQIDIKVIPNEEVEFQCFHSEPDYSILREVRIDAGDRLGFKFCPTPGVPLSSVAKINNVSRIKDLSFHSKLQLHDTLQSYHFLNLSGLTKLSLAQNGITNVSADLLSNTKLLEKLDIGNNKLRPPPNLFESLQKLEYLNLEGNEISELPSQLFNGLTCLKELHLFNNHLESLAWNQFRELSNLTFLDISDNRLKTLPGEIFHQLKSLTHVKLNRNFFQTLPELLFSGNIQLRTVDFSYNQNSHLRLPKRLFQNLLSLEKINLNNIGIQELPEDIVRGSPNVKKIFLQHNFLQIIPYFVLDETKELQVLDISFNNLSSLSDGLFHNWKKLNSLNLSHNKITNLGGNDLLGLDRLEKLHLENNFLHNIDMETFRSTPSLRVINLRSNNLSFVDREYLAEDAFLGLRSPLYHCQNLSQIDLSNNSIPFIFPDWVYNMEYLSLLNLSHNAIQTLTVQPFMVSHNCEIDVSHNHIAGIKFHEDFDEFQETEETRYYTWHLEGNVLQCDCGNYYLFKALEKQKDPSKRPTDGMLCTDGQLLPKLESFCSLQTNDVWISIVVILTVAGCHCLLIAVYYRYREELLPWMYARFPWFPWFGEEIDKDKVYDVFVSFSHKDDDFVVNTLVPGLENGPTPLKLCVHYRDFIVGEWIPAQIAQSVQQSRRTLVVLSPHFLESVWGRMELRAAHCQALSDGRARVVVMMLEDIGPVDDLCPELRAYVTMNTYVKWGDPLFWEKLRYALPHHRAQRQAPVPAWFPNMAQDVPLTLDTFPDSPGDVKGNRGDV